MITDEEAAAMREQLALYDRQKAYQEALKRKAYRDLIEPIVADPSYADFQSKILAIRTNNQNDGYFGVALDSLYHSLEYVRMLVDNWNDPVDPNISVTPTGPNPDASAALNTPSMASPASASAANTPSN